MKQRIVWGLVTVAAVAVVVLVLAPSNAQRPGGGGGFGGGFGMMGPMGGRFTVAHASADAVLILDTATGQVYKAGAKDFKKMSELPKMGEGGMPFGKFEKKDRPFRDREKKEREDGERKERKERDRKEGEERRRENDGRD